MMRSAGALLWWAAMSGPGFAVAQEGEPPPEEQTLGEAAPAEGGAAEAAPADAGVEPTAQPPVEAAIPAAIPDPVLAAAEVRRLRHVSEGRALVAAGKATFVSGAAVAGVGLVGIVAGLASYANCQFECYGSVFLTSAGGVVAVHGTLIAAVGGGIWGGGAARVRRFEHVDMTFVPQLAPGQVGGAVVGRF